MQVGGVGGSSNSSISMKACKGLGGLIPLNKIIMTKTVANSNDKKEHLDRGSNISIMENYH